MRYRIETDPIGELKIPAEAYYGIHTARSANSFAITKRGINRQMIKALTIVKKAAAKTNLEIGEINEDIAQAIMASCDEILNGRLHGQFITDLIQGGSGHGMNMNACEVIANRANEMLGGKKGTYEFVDPLKHVNLNQTTNDVIPTSAKIALTKQLKKLQVELKKLQVSLASKAKEFSKKDQNTLSLFFTSFSSNVNRNLKRIDIAISNLSELNMGVSLFENNNHISQKYFKKIVSNINKCSGEEFVLSKDILDCTRSLDVFSSTSSILKLLGSDLSKIASDIIVAKDLNIYGTNDLVIPLNQENPEINGYDYSVLDLVKQVATYVLGLDTTIVNACTSSLLELSSFYPLILMSLFDQLSSLRRAARTFREGFIDLL